ncbi:MAG: MFS transporter [Gammaproteobacteria bacterium]
MVFIISLGAVAAVIYTPALPMIQHQFGLDSATVQLTVSIFMLGYAFGQLLYGPLANRYGRKITLYGALMIGVLGSVMCIAAGEIKYFELLIAGRLVMALGTGAGLTMGFMLINDVYQAQEARRVVAHTTLAFAILPALAIFIGGFLVKHVNWQSCFYFIVVYCLALMAVTYYLPETLLVEQRRALNVATIVQGYMSVCRSSALWLYAAMWGIATLITYVFAGTAPIICISLLHVSPDQFGSFNLIAAAGYILGLLLSGRVAQTLSVTQVISLGWLLTLIASVLFLYFTEVHQLTIWTFYFAAFILFIGIPLIFSNSSAVATQAVADKASGSAMMSFINMSLAVAGFFLMTYLPGAPELIMPEYFLVLVAILGLLIVLSHHKKIKRL